MLSRNLHILFFNTQDLKILKVGYKNPFFCEIKKDMSVKELSENWTKTKLNKFIIFSASIKYYRTENICHYFIAILRVLQIVEKRIIWNPDEILRLKDVLLRKNIEINIEIKV